MVWHGFPLNRSFSIHVIPDSLREDHSGAKQINLGTAYMERFSIFSRLICLSVCPLRQVPMNRISKGHFILTGQPRAIIDAIQQVVSMRAIIPRGASQVQSF
jgi:hypothetical protein